MTTQIVDPLFAGVDKEVITAVLRHVTATGDSWEEEPMPLDRWLVDPTMLRLPNLSDYQYDVVLHAERVLHPETFEELGWEPVRQVLEIDLAWGKGPIAHDTPVLTDDGWKNHGDLEVGDRIYGGDGNLCTVTDVWPTVHEDCYRIDFGGESIVATAKHRWPVWAQGDGIRTTEQLGKGMLGVSDDHLVTIDAVQPVPTVAANCITVDSPDHTYLVGRRPIRTCNSGKDFISGVVLARVAYLLLCLRSPQAYFEMPHFSIIGLLNIATSSDQARLAFFEPLLQSLKGSTWYNKRMDPGATSIRFDKNIVAKSGHSSIESQEGLNLLVAVLDEISGFKTAAELGHNKKLSDREPPRSAEGIHALALESVRSRFGNLGKVLALSWTRFAGDPIDSRVIEAQADIEKRGKESARYASRAATWDVNPRVDRNDPSIRDAYQKDARDAQCRYECLPTAGAYTYFRNVLAVRRAMGLTNLLAEDHEILRWARVPTVEIEYEWREDRADESPYGEEDLGQNLSHPATVERWQADLDFSNLRLHPFPLSIHMDLGITHDAAGLAASHIEGVQVRSEKIVDPRTRVESWQEFRRPKVVTDFVVAFQPITGDRTRNLPASDIQIRWIRQLIYQLMAAGYVIHHFSADGYQSADTMQLLEGWGIETKYMSLDRNTEGYDTLKSLVYEGRVTVPFDPLLYQEITRLLKIGPTKIDHPTGGSKDMSDAWAGSVWGAILMSEEVAWDEGYVGETDYTSVEESWVADEGRFLAAEAPISGLERRFRDAR